MAWEISMTPEGWNNVYRNLQVMDRVDLEEAIIDDMIEDAEHNEGVDYTEDQLDEKRNFLGELPGDVLVDLVFEMIEKHNTCENGGFEVYMDREGYHTVKVDLLEGAENMCEIGC